MTFHCSLLFHHWATGLRQKPIKLLSGLPSESSWNKFLKKMSRSCQIRVLTYAYFPEKDIWSWCWSSIIRIFDLMIAPCHKVMGFFKCSAAIAVWINRLPINDSKEDSPDQQCLHFDCRWRNWREPFSFQPEQKPILWESWTAPQPN